MIYGTFFYLHYAGPSGFLYRQRTARVSLLPSPLEEVCSVFGRDLIGSNSLSFSSVSLQGKLGGSSEEAGGIGTG